MKKMLYSLIAIYLTTSVYADTAYCPDRLECPSSDVNQCTLVGTTPWYWTSRVIMGSNFKSGTYELTGASSNTGKPRPVITSTCEYTLKSSNATVLLQTGSLIFGYGDNWREIWKHHYECIATHHSAEDCPLKSYG